MKVKGAGNQLTEIVDHCREASGLMNSISLRFL